MRRGMSVFCAEARRTVMHRSTATTGVVVRRAPSVGTIPISIIVLFFASLRVLRELRANQLALRSLRGSRQHRRSREDREGPRRRRTYESLCKFYRLTGIACAKCYRS